MVEHSQKRIDQRHHGVKREKNAHKSEITHEEIYKTLVLDDQIADGPGHEEDYDVDCEGQQKVVLQALVEGVLDFGYIAHSDEVVFESSWIAAHAFAEFVNKVYDLTDGDPDHQVVCPVFAFNYNKGNYFKCECKCECAHGIVQGELDDFTEIAEDFFYFGKNEYFLFSIDK